MKPDEYEPFGPDWEKLMCKHTKKELVGMLRTAWMKEQQEQERKYSGPALEELGKKYLALYQTNKRMKRGLEELGEKCRTLFTEAARRKSLLGWFVRQCEGDSGTGASYWEEFPPYNEAVKIVRGGRSGKTGGRKGGGNGA